jgi:hypothetical protein
VARGGGSKAGGGRWSLAMKKKINGSKKTLLSRWKKIIELFPP